MMRFIDRFNHLRLQAHFLYDVGKANKLSIDQIKTSLEPLGIALGALIKSAPLKDRILAIKTLEHHMGAHIHDLHFIQSKIDDCKAHVDTISQSVKDDMKAAGSVVAQDGDYSATLVGDKLELR